MDKEGSILKDYYPDIYYLEYFGSHLKVSKIDEEIDLIFNLYLEVTPNWTKIGRGLNLQGICTNKICSAFK